MGIRLMELVCIATLAAEVSSGQAGVEPLPGDPLPGITAQDFERFRLGLEDFAEVETASEGLGPAFNGTSCAGCHSIPAVGGFGTIVEVRGGYRDEDGKFSELAGGTLYHLFSIPMHECQAKMPPEVNVIAKRMSIPLFGAGLVEAIPDQTILALEDPEDADNDGISGRAAMVVDPASGQLRVGRFGWKAQHATLIAFGADAYRNEMGITNDLFPDEVALGVDPRRLKLCDPASDPEDVRDRRTGLRGIDNFEAFLRFLAPLAPGPVNESAQKGREVFMRIGCAACHVPELRTGPSPSPPFDRQPVRLFSDLLLHDIGTGDGIEQAAAGAGEIRTPALWGLRFRQPFLHDGSASTVDEAIGRHAGEAQRVRENYLLLGGEDQAALLAFLRAL